MGTIFMNHLPDTSSRYEGTQNDAPHVHGESPAFDATIDVISLIPENAKEVSFLREDSDLEETLLEISGDSVLADSESGDYIK